MSVWGGWHPNIIGEIHEPTLTLASIRKHVCWELLGDVCRWFDIEWDLAFHTEEENSDFTDGLVSG